MIALSLLCHPPSETAKVRVPVQTQHSHHTRATVAAFRTKYGPVFTSQLTAAPCQSRRGAIQARGNWHQLVAQQRHHQPHQRWRVCPGAVGPFVPARALQAYAGLGVLRRHQYVQHGKEAPWVASTDCWLCVFRTLQVVLWQRLPHPVLLFCEQEKATSHTRELISCWAWCMHPLLQAPGGLLRPDGQFAGQGRTARAPGRAGG